MPGRYPEIDAVISYIHTCLDEPLPLSRLARYAGYSAYHFSRIFKEKTGLSPLYYVSSYRLQKAKDLLLQTNLSVRDIGLEVGQQSLGTFTTRFTEKVGVTPSQFRHSAQRADHLLRSLQNLSDWTSPQTTPNQGSSVAGTVETTAPFKGVILVGLFAKPIPEGLPLYGTLLPAPGNFCFTGVKPGTYYLMATSVTWEMQAIDFLLPNTTLRGRMKEPVNVTLDSSVPHQHLALRPPRIGDPPILISLPVLMNIFLNRVKNTIPQSMLQY